MANNALTEETVKQIAQQVLPGCRARMGYRIAWDDFEIKINYRDQVTFVQCYAHDLTRSYDGFVEFLKAEMPSEWFPKAAEPFDLDATG